MSVSKSEAVISWRKRTKQRILDSMGGKCSECSYDKCSDALELHHLNPTDKTFSFGGIRAYPRSWKTIVEELKKCILVCSNCHREIEAGIRTPILSRSTFNENFEEYQPLSKNSRTIKSYKYDKICLICNEQFKAYKSNGKFCSEKCRFKSKK